MKATELLKRQHAEIRDLHSRYGQTDDDDERQALFEELADTLTAHMLIEERIFYKAAYVGELQEQLAEAVEEHLAVKRELSDMLALMPDDESFDAKLKVLMDMFEHHVDEEENEILTKAEDHFGADQLEQLGERMEELFEEIMNEGPSDDIPLETEQAAALK
jgi:hypothetical protein